jgi:hypothetical protein
MTRTTRIGPLAGPWDSWQTTATDQVRLLTRLWTDTDGGSRWARRLMGQVDHGQAWGVGGVPGAVGVKGGRPGLDGHALSAYPVG